MDNENYLYNWIVKPSAWQCICLRFGASLCYPHKCCCCGADVNSSGKHGLSCRWNEGCGFCHAAINDIVHHSLRSANVPSQLEPLGLYRSDGK